MSRRTIFCITLAAMLSSAAMSAHAEVHKKSKQKSSKGTHKTAVKPKEKAAAKATKKTSEAADAQNTSSSASSEYNGVFSLIARKDWANAKAHAKQSGNTALITLVEWQYCLDQESGASFEDISNFVRKHPDWPQQNRLRLRAEQAMQLSGPSPQTIEAWFDDNLPLSGAGKIALAEAKHASSGRYTEDAQFLIRDAWRNGDFDINEEQRIGTTYAHIMREQDHIGRVDRLLWEDKTGSAERLLPLLPRDQIALMRARLAFINGADNALSLLSQVPSDLKDDPGLLYARMQRRFREEDHAGVRELLLDAPTPLPYAEKWWRAREIEARSAIADGDYRTARKLLVRHGMGEGANYAEAEWLIGWLDLQFLDNTQEAYLRFYKLFDAVKYPVSKSRAAYWAGRAAEKVGDLQAANSWYSSGSAYPTTFYGQMAFAKLHGQTPLIIPDEPKTSSQEEIRYRNRQVVQAFILASNANADELATQLLHHLIDTAKDDDEAAIAARIGAQEEGRLLGVRAAKRALQRNMVLVHVGYPRIAIPSSSVESPLTLALTRQESEFNRNAKSSAGALGLMQLLPSTAKPIAKKQGMAFSEALLCDEQCNLQLGTDYLGSLINRFDGSYTLAIAAYNAGPSRVRQWINQMGHPGNNVDAVVDWIERLPYDETRNYVQRVLENLQVYRHITVDKAPKLKLEEDLLR